MITLNFTQEECDILLEVLQTCQSDLRDEIADTHNHDYKEMLKKRKEVILRLVENLKKTQVQV